MSKLDLAAEVERLQAENAELRQAAHDLHPWSRRYCDGRASYAVREHNAAEVRAQHCRHIRRALHEGLPVPADVLADYPDIFLKLRQGVLF